MASTSRETGISKETFGVMLDHSGLILTSAQKAVLHDAYPMVRAMVVRATSPLPREAEPSVTFTSEQP